ncbi:tRNA 2-thiouridine(34) synthase MnmA [Candidatus Nitronereus thalassa]|uniref:tRNA-specific 2-thiouridylase MnmA n=1 Tax=Candidatus Nitronereus thalassa TaxID=3020898 RepID=A0ABU3K9C6_9BACT|nr:tRNA 2-thiouridine(34) synthase MnmA [Candidatus Nitronereus thalassa]MDT7042908.1 tRNA 2-thiouridine(34) synthase MnmA [Candidatus Nitronereus thalassa]
MSRPTVLLGMSGGVDSSVAALLLTEEGYDVRGVTLQVWEQEDETVAVTKKWEERGCCKVGLARHVAKQLNIPHEVVDTREAFQKGVIDDFVSGYLSGETPNPCVRCNERVKFGKLYHLAQARGVDFVATGHYARIKPIEKGYGLFKGLDPKKDQSYFLYRLSSSWLHNILFPLGHLHKTEVWKRAEDMGLPVEELQESQEICFVTQGDYREFLKIEAPQATCPGPFVDQEGQYLGEHRGIAFYTPGQRKGLGLATGERLYVQHVDPQTNTVTVGKEDALQQEACLVGDLNWLEEKVPEGTRSVAVKYRYASQVVPGTLISRSNGMFDVKFDTSQKALSPGQSAVFYDGDQVLGGGIIQRTSNNSRSLPLLPKTSQPNAAGRVS